MVKRVILPLLPFLLMEPSIVPTDSAPLVMEFPQTEQDDRNGPIRFEICADRIRGTQIGFDGFEGRPTLSMSFNAEAARELDDLTTRSVGKKVSIIFEAEVVSAPIIQEPITSGGILITGVDTVAEIERVERAARGRCTAKPKR